MLKLVLLVLVAIVVACHPDGGRAQQPVEAPHVEVQQPAAPQTTRPPPGSRPTAVQATAVDTPAQRSEDSDDTVSAEKRWVYASFFNRLKRKVAANWDPNAVWRRIDAKKTMYGTATRNTEVRVSLSPAGELVEIHVTSPSGVNELDDEAVRAFRAAAPFLHPPEALVLKDGRITFAFGFTFDLGHDAKRTTVRLPAAP